MLPMDLLTDPTLWASLFTLTLMEIVLGIDNVIFISILVGRLEESQRDRARVLGLGAALVMRIALLAGIVWIIGLTTPVFSLLDQAFSWRDLILIAGGGFLLAKATVEIHETIEGDEEAAGGGRYSAFATVIAQIMVLDVVFSLDSVLTAIGMTDALGVMIAAVVIAMGAMVWASAPISAFIQRHPTTKMLALSFLLLIGMALIADGLGFHIPRGYLYFAIAFSVLVEILNLARVRRRRNNRLRD